MRPDAVRRALTAELAAVREHRQPRVLDVGGGSGVWAVPLAAAGCAVTVVDTSPNALATLHRRAQDAGVLAQITALQGDSDALAQVVPGGSFDLVLGHGVLEVVDDPKTTVSAMAETAAPGGLVSVLVANRYAAVMHRAITGRLVDARRLLDDPAGQLPEESLSRRFDVPGLTQLLVDGGLTVELVQGHGVVADLVPGSVLEGNPGAADALAQLELAAATTPPLRDIAARLHALGRR